MKKLLILIPLLFTACMEKNPSEESCKPYLEKQEKKDIKEFKKAMNQMTKECMDSIQKVGDIWKKRYNGLKQKYDKLKREKPKAQIKKNLNVLVFINTLFKVIQNYTAECVQNQCDAFKKEEYCNRFKLAKKLVKEYILLMKDSSKIVQGKKKAGLLKLSKLFKEKLIPRLDQLMNETCGKKTFI